MSLFLQNNKLNSKIAAWNDKTLKKSKQN